MLLHHATMLSRSLFSAFSIVSLVFLMSGCQAIDDLSNIEKPALSPELAIPLVNTRLSVGDILNSVGGASSVVIEPNGQIKMYYEGKAIEKTASDLLSFPPRIEFAAPQASSSIPMQPVGGMIIKSVALKGGSIKYGFTASENLTVIVTIPELSKGGAAFRQTETVTAGKFQSAVYDLSGYTLAPSNSTLTISYEAKKANGSLVTNLDFLGTFDNLGYSYIEGYMTEQPYNFDRQQIILNLFTDFVSGNLEFIDPKVILTVENSFGFGMTSKISSMRALGLKSSGFIDTIPMTYPNKGFDFAYPSLSEKGQTKKTPFTLDRNNSNIATVLAKNPLLIQYDVDATTKSSGNNLIFLTDQSKIKMRADFELPLYLKASDFYYEQILNPDLSSLSDPRVQSAEMKIISVNRIPGTINMQIYFRNANKKIIDSLFSSSKNLLAGAPVDADGNVNGTNKQEFLIPIDRAKLDRIKDAKDMVLGTTLSTSNNGKAAARINDKQTVELRMGVKVKTQL